MNNWQRFASSPAYDRCPRVDERDGSVVAKRLGLTVVGTLGVPELAAEKDFWRCR